MDAQRLIPMVNQIARNLAAQGDDAAIAATCQHIRQYWDPRMIAAVVASDGAGLSPLARAAVDVLAREHA